MIRRFIQRLSERVYEKDDAVKYVTITIDGETIKFPVKTAGDYPEDFRVYIVKSSQKSVLSQLDRFLALCEKSGADGHSLKISIAADGDGSFRPEIVYPKHLKDLIKPAEIQAYEGDEVIVGED